MGEIDDFFGNDFYSDESAIEEEEAGPSDDQQLNNLIEKENQQVVKKSGKSRPLPKLNEATITGPKGIQALRESFKNYKPDPLKDTYENLKVMLEKCESLGDKRIVKVYMTKSRLDMPITDEDFASRRRKGDELLEQALVIEELLRRAAYVNLQNCATDCTAQLAQRFADIGNVADFHANVAKDSGATNRDANADSNATIKDPDALAGKSPLPLSGPFVTTILGQQLSGIQPKFADIHQPEKIYGETTDSSGDPSTEPAQEKKGEAEESASKPAAPVEEEAPMDPSASPAPPPTATASAGLEQSSMTLYAPSYSTMH
ncbi:hypothetical protein Aduo_001376 [Ancylostoma duodenale]